MISRIQKALSPLAVRIFLGFWLITIVSIVTTRIISKQLSNDYIAHPAAQMDVKQVARVANKLKAYAKNKDIADLSIFTRELFERRQFRRIYIKDVSNGNLYSAKPLKQNELRHYLSTETFDNPVSIHTKGFYLVGPERIVLGKKTLDVFWSHRGPSRHQPGFFSRLPPWARITIPLVISMILCWILSWSITRPIRSITSTTQELGKGDLTARVSASSATNSEIGDLASSVNQMASQLEALVTSQKRLLADISHELRSPLTRLQLALALAQKVDNAPAEMSKYLDRFELEIGRLDEMIADVLKLSRLENSIDSIQLQKINIVPLLTQIKEDADILASRKQISLQLNMEMTELEVNADAQLLASAIENIVTNAIKYGPEGSNVSISVSVKDDSLIVSILDEGKGVPEANIEQIFEPFYRVHDARDRATGGTGLGLAIAKRAVIAHNGSITAKNGDNGFCVSFILPILTND